MQFPECSLPFLGGHHSLVMFTLMSYMLISHGPSAPLWMGLWGDIPGLAGSAQGASSSASHPTATLWKEPRGHISGSQPSAIPSSLHFPAKSFHKTALGRCAKKAGPCADKLMQIAMILTETRSHG